ncbi:MAG: response regulator transcription factor [Spirochaetia bacterium]|nr:response regulator transcription factor [Spirochaetia bacterium]
MAAVISTDSTLELCGEAAGPTEAFAKLATAAADIVITDLNLGSVLNGLDFVRALRERFPDMRILINSMHSEKTYGERALRAGTNGFVSKLEGSKVLLDATHRALAGELVVSNDVQQRMVSAYISGRVRDAVPTDALTDRELEIYKMIGWGLSGKEISQALGISKSTIESHRAHIKDKLGLSSPAGLVRSAVAWVLQSEASGESVDPT